MPPHSLANFEIQKYYQNEPRFSGVYSRHNLLDEIKDGEYVKILGEYCDIETHLTALYALNNDVTCFHSFCVEHVPKEIEKFIDKSIVVTNISKIHAYNSIMCGYFCNGFILKTRL